MDISDTLAPDSDQLDAIDLAAGSRIFTVKSVSKGNDEQPVQVHLVEFPRPWRPGKNMRRVLAACWGVDASAWVGRRVELYCDPAVRFGADVVGGTRVRALSHIPKQQKIQLLVSRGKSATYVVEPLPDAPDLDYEPVTLPSLSQQLKTMGAMERADLYRLCGVESKLTADEAHALFTAKADELNLPFSDPPSVHAILSRARLLERDNLPAGAVEEFDRFAKTGESLDDGSQASIEAELLT